LHPAALGGGIDVADDGGGDRHDGAGAQSLQRAESDQRRHAPGEAAQRRAAEEDAAADDEHSLPAVEIGKPAIDRDGHRLGEEIGGEDPAQ
jgi:hypothetical protein